MPDDVRELCRLADITSKSLLIQIVRQESTEKMVSLIEKISEEGMSREQARKASRPARKGRPSHFVFKYGTQSAPFRLQMSFRKSQVEREEIIEALRRILEELETS